MKTTFLVNLYDRDGDLVDKGIYIDIKGDSFSTMFKVSAPYQLEMIADALKRSATEIRENYKEFQE